MKLSLINNRDNWLLRLRAEILNSQNLAMSNGM